MLGEKIAKLRNEKGLSQYELADRLGFSRGKLSNYEQGTRKPDYQTLKMFADFFDVTTDYLLGRTDKPNFELERDSEDESFFFFDKENVTADEMEALKEHLEFLRYKAAKENKKK